MERLKANFDSYELLETIGHGTIGTVYRARQIRLNRAVAVKFVDGDFAGNFSAEDFAREVEGLASLCHPNIAMVLDAGSARGQAFIVTELVEGVMLNEYIEAGKPGDGEIVGIMSQICDGMQVAHENDMLHLDLTPQHVLLNDSGWIKLVDFRMSRPFLHGGVGSKRGGPYLAPELMNDDGVDERADVYSIGKLLWLLSDAAVPPQHPENGELDVGGVRAPWKTLVERAVQTNPDDRFQSVTEMKAIGQELIAGCA